MATDLPLRCRCGRVQGVLSGVSPATGNRCVCYCDDCQAFAHFLERPDVLDAHGGTDIFQVAPAQLRITSGQELLRCMRLSHKGLFRWYADCCRTPVGNTMVPSVPFVGVSHAFIPDPNDGRSRDEVLGKPRGYVQRRFAVGGPVARELPGLTVGMVAHLTRLMLTWKVRGKGLPSPFFDERTRAPRVQPQVLSAEQRAELGRRALAHSG